MGRRSLAVTGLGLAVLGLTAGQASASYSAQVRGSTLQITGNRDSDTLVLQLQPGDPNTLVLDVGADGTFDFSFDRGTFTAIDVDAGAGDDQVTVSNNGGAITDEAIAIDGGSGDDRLIGGAGTEVFEGGSGNDFVDGNIGADAMFGGTGADTFQWDPGDGSDTVEGESGKDVLDFNGSNAPEDMDVSANGSRVRFFRNVGAITMDLDSLETIHVRTLGSADTVTVGDLSRTDLDLVDVDGSAIAGTPDGVADNVVVDGTAGADRVAASSPQPGVVLISGLSPKVQVSTTDPTLDTITVNGLVGADSITSNVGVTGPAAVVFNGGTESDTARYSGTDYDDEIGVARNADAVAAFTTGAARLDSIGVENLSVLGLDGADTIRGQNGIGALTHLTLEGGEGDDDLGGGDGSDTLLGGNGNDHVDGNIGADDANLGTGDDVFQWDPGDGSDTVDGKSGGDRMDFNGSNAPENIDVFRNGSRTRLTRNVGSITMDFDNLEGVAIRALGSSDAVTIGDLKGTGIDYADVNLGSTIGEGDASADTVVVNGTTRRDAIDVTRDDKTVFVDGLAAQTRITGSEPALDTLQIKALAGNDDVTVAPDVADLIKTLVDLGTE